MKITNITMIVLAAILFGYHQGNGMDGKMKKQIGGSPQQTQEALSAGGCFWCAESDFEKVDRVTETTSGYTGGQSVYKKYRKLFE